MSRHAKPGEGGERKENRSGKFHAESPLLALHNNYHISRSRKNEESVLLFALFHRILYLSTVIIGYCDTVTEWQKCDNKRLVTICKH